MLLPSATKLRRLCFHRCVSVHKGGVHAPGGWGCMVPGGGCIVGQVYGVWAKLCQKSRKLDRYVSFYTIFW